MLPSSNITFFIERKLRILILDLRVIYGKLFAYEIKYTDNKKKIPTKWLEYENGEFELINKGNLSKFIY